MATTAIPKTKISGGSFLLEERQTADVFTVEDFSEQQQMIGQTTEEFAINEILPQAEKIEHKDFSISRDLLKKAGDLGLSGVEVPEAYGGLEMDKVTAAIIADHIAKYAGFASISVLKNKRKNIYRDWPLEKWSAHMPCRKRLPALTR
jgi:hypothetical protein